jgi:IS30 family transposase
MYGRGITDDSVFLKSAINNMIDNLRYDGFGFIAERLIATNTLKVFFSKSFNRAVTGSMNDLIFQAKCYLEDEDISPYDLSQKLNEMPLSYIGYNSPREAFSKLKLA